MVGGMPSSEAHVTAVGNRVSKPSNAALMITNPASPPVVTGNTLISSTPADVVAILDGQPFAVDENRVSSEEENAADQCGASSSDSKSGPQPKAANCCQGR
jgi:hypothetical protein